MTDTPKKRAPFLHELLAVEQERKGEADKARRNTQEQFTRKTSHFTGIRRTFRPFSVDEDKGEVPGERLEAETRLVTTVPETIEEALKALRRALDVSYQIDEANTRARANLVIDDEVLAEDVPATFLLQLEKRLRHVRDLFEQIPTRDPVKLWQLDTGADKSHVFRAEPVVTIRKKRERKYNVMYEATKEHPAQIDIVEVDEPVGEIRSYEWSGMLSPGLKNALIERTERLIRAVKQARSRANTEKVNTERKIGAAITAYLVRPLE